MIQTLIKHTVMNTTKEHTKQYAQIVFLQGSEADDILRILDEEGEKSASYYLRSWDYGEYHDIRDESSAGKHDHVFIDNDGYIMSYNLSTGYIGLQREVGIID